jgi:hypothetical protein
MTSAYAGMVVAAAVVGCAWLGLGWEQTSIDHEDRYLVFIKSYPSTKVIYRSYMGCDECDALSYETLAPEQKVEFTAFCRAKYGFDDPRICDAMFRARIRIYAERLGLPPR